MTLPPVGNYSIASEKILKVQEPVFYIRYRMIVLTKFAIVIDSDLSQTFGQTIIHGLTLAVALVIMLSLGRLPLLAVTVVLAIMSDQSMFCRLSKNLSTLTFSSRTG